MAKTSRSFISLSRRPKMRICPLSGWMRPLASFMSTLLPQPAGPRMMRVSPWATAKLMPLSRGLPSRPVMETSSNARMGWPEARKSVNRFAVSGWIVVWATGYLPKMAIMSWVTRKSTRMMKTEEKTTAWVVARPTPRVPPVVRRP
jgi:hypothetical protein